MSDQADRNKALLGDDPFVRALETGARPEIDPAGVILAVVVVPFMKNLNVWLTVFQLFSSHKKMLTRS